MMAFEKYFNVNLSRSEYMKLLSEREILLVRVRQLKREKDQEFNAGVEAAIQICAKESAANPHRTVEEKAQYAMCLGIISELIDIKRPVGQEGEDE